MAQFATVAPYEEARRKLETFTEKYGPFQSIDELLTREFESEEWAEGFQFSISMTAEEREELQGMIDIVLPISQAFITYCRAYNRLYREVKIVVDLGVPEFLTRCLPQKLDAMDLNFLLKYCPKPMFQWVLTHWSNIEYNDNDIKSLLLNYQDETLDLIEDHSMEDIRHRLATGDYEAADIIAEFGYLLNVIPIEQLEAEEPDNIIYDGNDNPENIPMAIKYGLPLEKMLADIIKYDNNETSNQDFRVYFPFVASSMDIYELLKTQTSLDKIYFAIKTAPVDDITIDYLIIAYTIGIDSPTGRRNYANINGLFALHLLGFDSFSYYRAHKTHFDAYFTTKFYKSSDKKIHKHMIDEPADFDSEEYQTLFQAIEDTTDPKLKQYMANYDLVQTANDYFNDIANWSELPKEIKEQYLTLELIRQDDNSIYSALPPELTRLIFQYAYTIV